MHQLVTLCYRFNIFRLPTSNFFCDRYDLLEVIVQMQANTWSSALQGHNIQLCCTVFIQWMVTRDVEIVEC